MRLSPQLASAASLFYGVATDDVQLVWCLLSVKAAVAAARPLSAYIRPQTVTGTASRSFSNAPCSARPGAWRASRRRGALLPSLEISTVRRGSGEEPGEVPARELLNHLVGTSEESRWDREAEGCGRLEIDDKLECRRLLNRQVARFCTAQNQVHIAGC